MGSGGTEEFHSREAHDRRPHRQSPRDHPPAPGYLRRRQRHGARAAGHGRYIGSGGTRKGTYRLRPVPGVATGHRSSARLADQRSPVPADLRRARLRVVVRVGIRPLVRRRRGLRGTRRAAATAVARLAQARQGGRLRAAGCRRGVPQAAGGPVQRTARERPPGSRVAPGGRVGGEPDQLRACSILWFSMATARH